MEDFTRYFMGEALGNLTVNGWKWLWGMPPSHSPETATTNDDIILADLARSLDRARSKLDKIQGFVDRVGLVAQAIQHQYQLKCERHRELVGIALESNRQGNILAARTAVARSIQLERLLPELKKRAEISQEMSIGIQEIYAQKIADLALLEIDLEMSKAQRDLNNSISSDRSHDLTLLHEKLQQIQSEVEDRYHQIQVEFQLANSSNCELKKTLKLQDLDDRIKELKNIDERTQDLGN